MTCTFRDEKYCCISRRNTTAILLVLQEVERAVPSEFGFVCVVSDGRAASFGIAE